MDSGWARDPVLDDEAPEEHDPDTEPRPTVAALTKDDSPEQHARQREYPHVGSEQAGEVELERDEQDAVGAEEGEAQRDQGDAAAGHAFANQRVTADLEQRRADHHRDFDRAFE